MDYTLVASFLLLFMFFISGINKVKTFKATVKSFSKRVPVPFPSFIIFLVIILEIFAPLVIVTHKFLENNNKSNKMIRMLSIFSTLCLILFTILATLLYHPLKINKPYMKNIPFYSNMSVTGGLILLLLNHKLK